MNFDIKECTILRVKHGSHAYGTNVATSDLDIKGVCIEPIVQQLGFLHSFEQHERLVSKGHDHDEVIYSLKKFVKLAADCNPNIIEVLWGADEDVLFSNSYGDELRSMKEKFLSKRARFSFSGYAHAQLHRIKTHRSWLLDPPKKQPVRSDYGLSDTTKVSKSELGAFDAAVAQGIEVELPKDILTLFNREKQYIAAKTHWDQYINWKNTRNPARAELEAKHGFDTKHGMHLIRLMRMCKEILVENVVHVKRPDREELLSIRSGAWSYDRLIEEAERLDAECAELYKTSTLRDQPDRTFLNNFTVDLTLRHGGHK